MTDAMINKIRKAIEIVESGVSKRVDIDDNVKVYAVKNVVRIDIKSAELERLQA